MRYAIYEEHEKGLMIVVTHGHADIEGFEGFTREVSSKPLWGRGLAVLVDHRDLDLSALSRTDVEWYRDFCTELFTTAAISDSEKIRVASLMGDGISYGIARQWEIPLGKDLSFIHRTFLSFSEAAEWLGVAVEDRYRSSDAAEP